MASMYFSRCYTAHDRRLGSFFGRYGQLIARYPWLFIILSIAINFVFGIGILRIEYETDIEKQYFLENSRAFQDRDLLRRKFNTSDDNFQIHTLADVGYFAEITVRSKDDSNVFAEKKFAEVLNIDKLIRQRVVFKDDYNISRSYEDTCAKNKQRCVVFGDEILHPNFISSIRSYQVTFPIYNNIFLSSIVGNVTTKDKYLISAAMVKFRYYLPQVPESTAAVSRLWIRTFIDYMETLVTNETDIAYSYYNAMEDEVKKSSMAEAHLFPLTIILMIVYASISTTGKKIDCVYDLQNLGRVGVFCAFISIVPAVGIASAIGLKFMNSVAVMPFLIIGIGINDMFIIMSGHAETIDKTNMAIEERMKRTLMTSGLAVTVTSLTDIITFMIGYTSVFNTIKNFCVYTGLAVFFCYINQLTILAPCIVLQQRRMDKLKHSYTCKVTKPREELRKEGRSACYIKCCSGEKPKTRTDMESVMETYLKRLIIFLVKNKISKIVILVIYAAYIGVSIWGVQSLKQSTKYSDLAVVGSNYYKSSVWDYDYFPLEIPVQVVFTSPLDYEKNTTQIAIENLLKKLKNYHLMRNDTEINWLSSFKNVSGIQPDRYHFYNYIKLFANSAKIFEDDIVLSEDQKSITASRVHLFSKNMRTTELQADFLTETREIIDASGLPCTIYTPLFVFFEQYATMIPSTLQTVGVAISAMFFVTCFFMPHPMIITIVTVSIVSILLGVFGFLKFWGLDISVVTMIELIISVGFSVDFSTHICHAYLSSASRDKESRVIEALELAGGPVINGSISTILGLVMLIFSKSFIFQSFFKVLFMVVSFGLLHAVLVLPIILTLVGPKVRVLPKQKEDLLLNDKQTSKENQNNHKESLHPIKNGV